MRLLVLAIACGCAWAHAQEPGSAPAKPKTYALVSAMGEHFNSVYEEPRARTGTRLEPYRRDLHQLTNNALNKLVLASLDQSVGKLEPASKRIYLAVATPRPRVERAHMDALAMEIVTNELRAMPERAQWDRIVVATPAYRTQDKADGLPGRLQGAGVSIQGVCQSQWLYCDVQSRPATSGAKALTPQGEEITVSRYVATFLSLRISILDPRTLEVLDSHEVFEHVKYFDPRSDSFDMVDNVGKKFLATKIVEIVDKTTREAVMATELRGQVDVKERGTVKEGAK